MIRTRFGHVAHLGAAGGVAAAGGIGLEGERLAATTANSCWFVEAWIRIGEQRRRPEQRSLRRPTESPPLRKVSSEEMRLF